MTKSQGESRGLADQVRRRRTAAGLGLRELARRASLNATWVMRIEQGVYTEPDPRRLAQLARALDLEVVDLYEAAGYPTDLPAMQPYLRNRYGYLPAEAIDQLIAHFDLINDKYQQPQKGGSDEPHHHPTA